MISPKSDVGQNRRFDVKQRSKKVQKDPASGPKTDLLGQHKREGGRAETKNAGVKKFSSFIWTLVVIGPYRALYGPYSLGPKYGAVQSKGK